MPDGFQTEFLTGFAVLLDAAALGDWNPSETYGGAETAITLRKMPQAPDRIICLSAYGVMDDASLSTSVMGLQVRCRWSGQDPRPVDDLADELFDLLHGREHLELSTGVHIVLCLRQSYAPLGQDQNGRWENASNFYCTVHRPSTNRT